MALKERTYARVVPGGVGHVVDETKGQTLCGYTVPPGAATKADTIWRITPCQTCAGVLRRLH